MSLPYQEHLSALHAALDACQQKSGTEIGKVESCFKCCLEHWSHVQRQLRYAGFSSTAEEIHFFKEIKHRFTAPIEYYTHRYHALLFIPTGDEIERVRFWKWELRKIDKFYEENADFCRYILEGGSNKDNEYFLRRISGAPHPSQHFDTELATPWDHLLTLMGAYEMYRDHIRAEMRKLGGYFFLTK